MTVFLIFVVLATCSYGCYGATIDIRGWWSRFVAVNLGLICLAFVSALWWFLAPEYVYGGGTIWHLCLLLVSAAFGLASLIHGLTRTVQPTGYTRTPRLRHDCHRRSAAPDH